MIIRKGYKYRLKTDSETVQKFAQFVGSARFVWNKVLSTNEGRYIAGTPRLSFTDSCRPLTLWKQSEAYGFLAGVHSQVLQQCLKDLDHAYANLVAGRAGPLTYRKKFLTDSFRFPQGFKVEGNRVSLPKIGWVQFWESRDIQGTIKNVTVSRRGEHWFASLRVEMEVPDPIYPFGSAVGIDMGIATFLDQGWGYVPPHADVKMVYPQP
jgi:putative transposase